MTAFGPDEAASRFLPYRDTARALLAHLPSGDDGSHDLAHVCRVWENVKAIVAVEGGDLGVLLPATVLHDCVQVEKNSPDRPRASAFAARKAAEVLTGMGHVVGYVEAVAHAIEAHSYSAGVEPRSREAEILRDADRLDAIGAVGVARCFYVSGRMGRPLYDPADPAAERRAHDDVAFALDHFPVKLLKLADGMRTRAGRELAARRMDVMERFLADFRAEIGVGA